MVCAPRRCPFSIADRFSSRKELPMEARQEQRTAEVREVPKPGRPESKPQRFRIDKLEERIAPRKGSIGTSADGSCPPIWQHQQGGWVLVPDPYCIPNNDGLLI